jgi:hypothetical protein
MRRRNRAELCIEEAKNRMVDILSTEGFTRFGGSAYTPSAATVRQTLSVITDDRIYEKMTPDERRYFAELENEAEPGFFRRIWDRIVQFYRDHEEAINIILKILAVLMLFLDKPPETSDDDADDVGPDVLPFDPSSTR